MGIGENPHNAIVMQEKIDELESRIRELERQLENVKKRHEWLCYAWVFTPEGDCCRRNSPFENHAPGCKHESR